MKLAKWHWSRIKWPHQELEEWKALGFSCPESQSITVTKEKNHGALKDSFLNDSILNDSIQGTVIRGIGDPALRYYK